MNDAGRAGRRPAGRRDVRRSWETDAQGWHPERPRTIQRSSSSTPARSCSRTHRSPFTNDYPTGRAELVKLVEGDAQEEFTGGPFTVRRRTASDPTVPTEPFTGLPGHRRVVPRTSRSARSCPSVPVHVQELDVPEGVTVTYDPPNADGTAGEVVVPSVSRRRTGFVRHRLRHEHLHDRLARDRQGRSAGRACRRSRRDRSCSA